ncbi:MAG TPA: hypothetical protein VN817_02625 [Solirubrobacteraceae bacterium]|nr:hypothetical protein [Solirubrobacteraceae bacterium]
MSAVRRALLNARYDRFAVRIGGPDASMKGQWPTLLLASVVVFACFFAIGRIGTGGTSPGEPSSALRAFSSRAAIPGGLRGDSPIAGSVPSAIAPRPARSAASTGHSASSEASAAAQQQQPLAENASGASTPSPSTQVAPVVQPAPVKTSAPVAASPQPSSSAGPPSSSGGGAHPSSPSGGSFDSSE